MDGAGRAGRRGSGIGEKNMLAGTIGLTGATGFIGGRLVERLMFEHGVCVRTLVRNYARVARIARFPVEMVHGTVEDRQAIHSLVRGCEVVFHCAHDWQSSNQNLAGVKLLAEACLAHRVRRLVFTSTISVYEPLRGGELDETASFEPSEERYTANKRAAEEVLLKYRSESGLPVVILQPTIVFGPFSKPWTVAPVSELRRGRVILPEGARTGLCNAVYVDDVVEALVLAAVREGIEGERFLISGENPVYWIEFFRAYADILGRGDIAVLPDAEVRRLIATVESESKPPMNYRVRLSPGAVLSQLIPRPVKRRLMALLGEARWGRLKEKLPPEMILPSRQALDLYSAPTRVRIDKARRLLGYRPQYDFQRGMALTADFIRWANI
ncbi:MAG TPA: NAD-dependent epimerase/dehydratase family protein [Terriglobales bacterium]|nr:NAD-dependent epimerase/dehydratase family protein [Terriglobales bacterium]